MVKKLLLLSILFLAVRAFTIYSYNDYYYYYSDFAGQFGIASAAYDGHWANETVHSPAIIEANKLQTYIPIEKWKDYEVHKQYFPFPAVDLPGYGYIIAFTSKHFDHQLTSKYAFAIQIALELASILLFVFCISLVFNERTAFIAGLLYILAYPSIWPLASQPCRDMFILAIYTEIIATFLIFIRKIPSQITDPSSAPQIKTYWLWTAIAGVLAFSSLLLWVRPSAYYYPFLISPLVFFIKEKNLKQRCLFFLMLIIIPLAIFGIPFKYFNLKYYHTADTHILGRGLWEGLGVVEDNPYGFVFNDAALVPFVETFYHKKVEYSSPEMNEYLTQYAISVVKKDPCFYLKAISTRLKNLFKEPINAPLPNKVLEVISAKSLHYFCNVFFWGGILLNLIGLLCSKKRFYFLLFLSPLIYTLIPEIILSMEPRVTMGAAWVLVFPYAWFLNFITQKYKYLAPHYLKYKSIIYGLPILLLVAFLFSFIRNDFLAAQYYQAFSKKTYSIQDLPWQSDSKNSLQLNKDGLQIVTDISMHAHQAHSTIVVPPRNKVLLIMNNQLLKGGVETTILNEKGDEIQSCPQAPGLPLCKNMLIHTGKSKRITIMFNNYQDPPQQSEFLVKQLDVYIIH